jgi:1-deoxyxylulose-5-phosphate synthase
MDQIRLGASGLYVSRLGLGMMSYGSDASRPWMLDEAAAEPIVRRAVESGFTFFDTADMYSQGASEVVTGRLLRKLLTRDEVVIATKVYYEMTPGPNGRGLSRNTSSPRSTPHCSASSWSTSTSTRSTGGTPRPRSRRRWRPCTTS